MQYSNKLELNSFFWNVRDQQYVIVKNTSFPNYFSGDDIDIFCDDATAFAKEVLMVGNSYIENLGMEIEVTTNDTTGHIVIDFRSSGVIEFRFDIFSAFPEMKNLSIKGGLFHEILRDRITFESVYNNETYPVYIPSAIDDVLLRYIEYMEWHRQRPDKVKHLEYVLAKITSDKDTLVFIDKLHRYTKLHKWQLVRSSSLNTYLKRIAQRVKEAIPIKIKGVARRLKRLFVRR